MADIKLFELLQKIAAEENIEQPDIQVEAISTGGANFSSNLYLANISDKTNNKSLKLFAKIAAMSEATRNSFNPGNFPIYDIERIAYSNLFKLYRQLEEKHGLPEEHKLVLPKYYGAESTYLRETIVLEDLGSRGFMLYSRFQSVDWPYAAAALTELAKFHALSFTYQHENPVEFNKLVNDFPGVDFPDDEETKATFSRVAQLAINTVHEKNKEKLTKFLDGKSMAVFGDQGRALKHTVLIHGDFRPSNMLYRKGLNGTEVIPVDYQTIKGGCPASDLVYFVMTATDGPFRAQYYQALVEHYYSELGAALARLGLDVEKTYPREDFNNELKQKLPNGLLLSVLPLLTTPEDEAPKAEEFNIHNGLAAQPGDLYQVDSMKWWKTTWHGVFWLTK